MSSNPNRIRPAIPAKNLKKIRNCFKILGQTPIVNAGERDLNGVTIGYAIDKYHQEPKAVDGDFYATRFNLLILTDRSEDAANSIVSRN